MSGDNDWVTVASTYFLAEADVLRSVLEDHDIPVFLKGEHTAGLVAPLSLLDRGVRIQVPRCEQVRAEEILQMDSLDTNGQGAGNELDADRGEMDDFEDDLRLRGSSMLAWAVMTALGLALLVLLLFNG